MINDLRYAFRSLRHSPFLSLSAIAVLGIAIAANATIISLVDGLWLRPAGFASVGRSVRAFTTTPTSQYGRWSFPEYTALRDGAASLTGVAACGRRGTLLRTDAGEDELTLLNVVSLNFFEALGVKADRGRVFGSADAESTVATPIVVLGHGFWRRHFGGDASIVGRTLRIGGGSLVVTVHDHGPGIASEQARAIFAAFDRGGRDAADPIPGVGLGLALSRGLARDMGGDLTLDAPSGTGASFRLVVPARTG